mgnify:CR=1 FL=1
MRDWAVLTPVMRTMRGHTKAVRAVRFSPDGGRRYTGSDDMLVSCWDVAAEETVRTFEGHTDVVRCLVDTGHQKIDERKIWRRWSHRCVLRRHQQRVGAWPPPETNAAAGSGACRRRFPVARRAWGWQRSRSWSPQVRRFLRLGAVKAKQACCRKA